MSDWRPIETAPKDGTWVDLWCIDKHGEGWRVVNCHWTLKGPDLQAGDWAGPFVGINAPHRAIAWMPLPEPPK
jgi:hypothetical protein